MTLAHNPLKKTYPEQYIKAVDAILKTPEGTPQRWRKSVALYLNLNPTDPDTGVSAKLQYQQAMADVRDMRIEQANKFGTNKSDSMRLALHAPAWFTQIIETFDKWTFDRQNPALKENARKLYKEFQELRVMEKV